MGDKLKRFEVSLYNKQVRDLEKENKEHPNFSRDWARLHFLSYEAKTEDDVIAIVRKKHPERKGFVIDEIVEIKEYDFVEPGRKRH